MQYRFQQFLEIQSCKSLWSCILNQRKRERYIKSIIDTDRGDTHEVENSVSINPFGLGLNWNWSLRKNVKTDLILKFNDGHIDFWIEESIVILVPVPIISGKAEYMGSYNLGLMVMYVTWES